MAVCGPPVRVIFATPGWDTSAAPASRPYPETTLRTPGGIKSWINRTNSRTLAVAYSEGLTTIVFHVASAGAILFARVIIGEFQEMRAAITPNGSLIVYIRELGSSTGIWSPR